MNECFFLVTGCGSVLQMVYCVGACDMLDDFGNALLKGEVLVYDDTKVAHLGCWDFVIIIKDLYSA